jgi:hypothetical protein
MLLELVSASSGCELASAPDGTTEIDIVVAGDRASYGAGGTA